MKKKLLSFDVDSVLLDTEEVIFDYIEEHYQTKLTAMDVKYWTFYIEHFPSVLQYFGNPLIYQKVKPVNGMVEVMELLVQIYGPENIQLVTSSHPDIKHAKEDAINKYYGHIPGWNKVEIIHVGLNLEDGNTTHHKHEYTENTLFFDDALHNMKDHLNYNHYNIGFLIDYGYGWNQNFEHNRCVRITNVNQIIPEIKKILKI